MPTESMKSRCGPSREQTFRESLLEAQTLAMRRDSSVICMGLGVDDAKGIFGSTLDLHKEFGPQRVMDTPLAENGTTGIAIGAALAGMRPVLVHQRVDFLLLTMDQLVNHAAKWHYMFGGGQSVPLVVRAVIGRGWGQGAQHSQSLQSMFAHVPGLKVVMPATAADAKGLLLSAIEDPNPVIFLEHRHSYEQRAEVPEGHYTIPIGKADVARRGDAATVVAFSHMVTEALKAADELAARGVSIEVLNMRSVRPLDTECLLESIRKTGRLVIADTGWKTCGVSAEVAALAVEEAFDHLQAPVVRVALPEVPTPTSPALEEAYYPGPDDIVDAVGRVLSDKRLRREPEFAARALTGTKNFEGAF